MKLTTLDEDLRIHQKLEDEPNDVGGLSAQALKEKFDQAGVTIQKYLNETHLPEEEQAVAGALSEAKAYTDKKTAVVADAVSRAKGYTDQKAEELTKELGQVRAHTDEKAAELTEGLSQARAYTDQKTAALEQAGMKTAVYDKKQRQQDIFDYTDERFEELKARKSGGAWACAGETYTTANYGMTETVGTFSALTDPDGLWSNTEKAFIVPEGGRVALVLTNVRSSKGSNSDTFVKIRVNGEDRARHCVGHYSDFTWNMEGVSLLATVKGGDRLTVVAEAYTAPGTKEVSISQIVQVAVIILM